MYLIVCVTALAVAVLTLFSGFGLGTLLMPAFALFFPLGVAVAATAVVHLANNLFKFALLWRHASLPVILRFALPAALASFAGAWLLAGMSDSAPLAAYRLGGHEFQIMPVKLLVAVVIALFSLAELSSRFGKLAFDRKYLPLGGLLSGFFGGLTGNQGALRSLFLARAGLDKEAFVATATVAAVAVDATRLLVYGFTFLGAQFSALQEQGIGGLLLAATLSAFAGSYAGKRLLKKVTLEAVQRVVAAALLLFSVALAAGWV